MSIFKHLRNYGTKQDFKILIQENYLIREIAKYLLYNIMLNIMLELLFLISTFTLNMGQDPKNQIVQFLTIFNLHSVLEIGKILVLELMSPALHFKLFKIVQRN